MVSVKSFKVMTNPEGQEYCILMLEGEVEMAKSSTTGKFYATTKTCNVPTTFDEDKCKELVGALMPGRIVRVETDPYEYEIPTTGEKIMLSYTYEYDPNEPVRETAENGALF